MNDLLIFLAASAIFLVVSRASLRMPGSRGFYRFFAWELLLLLFLHSYRGWFSDPFSVRQIVSWLLLLFSLYLVAHGMLLLRTMGRPGPDRNEPGLVGPEQTTVLVTAGIYGAIRHPLYSSLLLLGWGIFLKHPDWLATLLALAASATLLLIARIEENENLAYFGPAYREYMRRTKMFVPYLF